MNTSLSLLAAIGITSAGYGLIQPDLPPAEGHLAVDSVIKSLRQIQQTRDYQISQYARILHKPEKAFHAPGHLSATDLDALEDYLQGFSPAVETNDAAEHSSSGWIMPAPEPKQLQVRYNLKSLEL